MKSVNSQLSTVSEKRYLCGMKLIRNPWVWLCRFRHRKGYGVHSPTDYAFIRGVLLEPWQYYAYEELDALHPWWVRAAGLYPLACRRLLFRLANAVHPRTIRRFHGRPVEEAYMAAAVPSAEWVEGAADFVFVPHECLAEAEALVAQMGRSGMMVLEGIHADAAARALWQRLQQEPCVGITYDLYTYGILCFDRSRHPHHYIVSF